MNSVVITILIISLSIVGCSSKHATAVCGGTEDSLELLDSVLKNRNDTIYYKELLPKIYPNIHLRGKFYEYGTQLPKSNDDYCSIIMVNILSNDTLYLNGQPSFGKEFEYGKYALKYRSINCFNIHGIKNDTILTFDSLSLYRLDVYSNDTLRKVRFSLKKVYQTTRK